MTALRAAFFTDLVLVAATFQQCYFGPGAANRGPSNLVPCLGSGQSACCLLGDTCISGNACYNYATGDLYQYGCTDIHYQDSSCPYKCGFNTTLSPWTALEYCQDLPNVTNTWVCHAPESCGCQWNATYNLLTLQRIGCKEMGSNARVGLFAPSELAPYVSLPSTVGGSTGYYSGVTVSGKSTWVITAVAGYTPSSIGPLTTYGSQPRSAVLIVPGLSPAASTFSIPSTLTSAPVSASETLALTSTETRGASATTVSPGPIFLPPGGLSPGAKAGIGVGVAFGVLLISAVAFLSWSLLRKRLTQGSTPSWQHNFASGTMPAPQHLQGLPGQELQQTSPYAQDVKQDWPSVHHENGHLLPASNMLTDHAPPGSGSAAMHLNPAFSSYAPMGPYMDGRALPSPPMELSAERPVYQIGSDIIHVNEMPATVADKSREE